MARPRRAARYGLAEEQALNSRRVPLFVGGTSGAAIVDTEQRQVVSTTHYSSTPSMLARALPSWCGRLPTSRVESCVVFGYGDSGALCVATPASMHAWDEARSHGRVGRVVRDRVRRRFSSNRALTESTPASPAYRGSAVVFAEPREIVAATIKIPEYMGWRTSPYGPV